jgi:DNA-binding NarL/FixJ family response regulator
MKDRFNILIVEDELITAEHLKECIYRSGFKMPFIRDNFDEALAFFYSQKFKPNLLLCDIKISGEKTGLELVEKVRQISDCEIIILSANNNSKNINFAAELDVPTFLVKPYTDDQLITAVNFAYKKFVLNTSKEKINLSPREFEIYQLVKKGKTSKEIAEILCLSIETIHTHRRNILQKNEVKNFNELP